jgi:hypothetical protein
VTVGRLHGDPSLDNLLFTADGTVLTGMVDWEASTIGLPECDLMVLLLARRVSLGGEIGDAVVDLLTNGWNADEQTFLDRSWAVNPQLRPTTAVLLTWLGHVAANLEKTDRYRANRWWVNHNVQRVLAHLAATADPEASLADAPHDSPAEAEGADDPADAQTRPGRTRVAASTLRWTLGTLTIAAGASVVLHAPMAVRVVLVLAVTVAIPAAVIGRCLGTPGSLVRGVIGSGGAVAAGMLWAEVLLYAGLWSPLLWLVVVSVATIALTFRIPPYQPTRTTPPTPADAIVRRARSDKALR